MENSRGMKRENKVKILAEVVEIGRFIATAGMGGFIAWLVAVLASGPSAHLHILSFASLIFVGVTVLGFGLWIIGTFVKPEPAPGPPGPTGPTGPQGAIGAQGSQGAQGATGRGMGFNPPDQRVGPFRPGTPG